MGADHKNIAFRCATCDKQLCTGPEIIRMGDTALYVDFEGKQRTFCVFGKPKLNIYKQIETRCVSCQGCRTFLGHFYPHLPGDRDSGPCCKLFYFDQKRGEYAMYVPWSEARYDRWLEEMADEIVSHSEAVEERHVVEDVYTSRHPLAASRRAAVEAGLKAGSKNLVEAIAKALKSDDEVTCSLTAGQAPVLAAFDWSDRSSAAVREFITAYLDAYYSVQAIWAGTEAATTALPTAGVVTLTGTHANVADATSYLRHQLKVNTLEYDLPHQLDARTRAALRSTLESYRPTFSQSNTSRRKDLYVERGLKLPMSVTFTSDQVICRALKPFDSLFPRIERMIAEAV